MRIVKLKFLCRAFLVVAACLATANSELRAANSFVEGYSDFKPVDTATDSEGFTYILGTRNGTIGVLRKIDASGGFVFARDLTNSSGFFTPRAFKIGVNNKIYIATANNIIAVDRDASIERVYSNSGANFSSVGYYPELSGGTVVGAVYASGTEGGRAVLYKLSADLTTLQARKTYGSSQGSTTANSLVIDDAGSVYVGGFMPKLFSGNTYTFTSDFAFSGAQGFRIETYTASDGACNNLEDLDNLIAGIGRSGLAISNATNLNVASIGPVGVRALGQLYIAEGEEYTFYSTSDDGSALYIDGIQVIYDNTGHAAQEFSGKIKLRAGLHDVDYRFFNSGGPGSYNLKFGLTSTTNKNFVTAIRPTGIHAYVLKLSPDLTSAETAYYQTLRNGTGGEYFKLVYSGGWIYAAGHWQGAVETGGVVLDSADGKDIEIVKLDTNLKMNGRATVKGANNQVGYGLAANEDGYVYFSGSFGPGSCNFIGTQERTTSVTANDGKFASISSSSENRFLAKLDPAFNFEWVKVPQNVPPSFNNPADRDTAVAWNTFNGKAFWVGSFVQGNLTLGEPNSVVTIPATSLQGFVAVLEPDGKYTQRVKLTIVSQYGKSGTQVLPFGQPFDVATPRLLIKDSVVAASVPKFIYRDINNQELPNPSQSAIEQQAEIRFAATGYSLDNGTVTGDKESYVFTLTQDTRLEFKWSTEFALTIANDLTGTAGAGGGLTSEASGNPDPIVKKHFIRKDEIVAPQIDGSVLDLNANNNVGLVRYLVTGYDAFGPPNTFTEPNSTNINFFAFSSLAQRQQISQFAMTAPAKITYKWKKQFGVQINTTGFESANYPLVRVLQNPPSAPFPQQNGVGSGSFWYDEHTSLQILTIQKQDLKQLKGFLNGDGVVFGAQGTTNELPTSIFTNGVTYLGKSVTDLMMPVKVLWDYGDRIFTQTNYIGNSVRLDSTTIDDPAILSRLRTTTSPDFQEITVDQGPGGSTANDMAVWDEGGQKLYPVRPGTLLIQWKTTDANPAARVLIRVIIKYPDQPHYNHIANTPAVNLDPDATDSISFREIKYSESGASLTGTTGFSCLAAGKTVLLFTEVTTGRGTSIETLRVRVVQTKLYNDGLGGAVAATIGTKITSSFDTAGLQTGYIFFPNARYNPLIYDRANVAGPIIPVNLEFEPGIESKIIVVWYENRDKILWPYKPVQYAPQWPSVSTGLNRIVISSRFGSECVATNGQNQIITLGSTNVVNGVTNNIPSETYFNPSRFQQTQIYTQPDRTKAGYNPNEEHALVAPSLRYAAVSPRPLAAYALRDNDLNVTNKTTTYTSDPYVLVQFLDTLDNEFKMKVFKVVREDSNTALGPNSYSYRFEQEMKAGEPVIPFYPLGVVIGATPCNGTYGREGAPGVQRTYWKDHKGTSWAISGDGYFFSYFYYPMSPDFWWPTSAKIAGDCVAWLPNTAKFEKNFFDGTNGVAIDYRLIDQVPAAQQVKYTTVWPDNLPVLKVGETLTFSGGEFRADNPTLDIVDQNGNVQLVETPGLPGLLAWASGEIIFDTLNPLMDDQKVFDKYSARVFQALEERSVTLSFSKYPINLSPASGQVRLKGGKYVFTKLPASLQKRVTYDPILGKLAIQGFLNDKEIGDSTLTAAPAAVYVLEPNLMTPPEKEALLGLQPDNTDWTDAVNALYKLARNPNLLDRNNNGFQDNTIYPGLGKADDDYRIGLEQKILRNADGTPVAQIDAFGRSIIQRTDFKASPLRALGPGLAMAANPAFMDPNSATPDVSYVTVAENNHEALGGSPVILHIIKVDKRARYRGAIKTILSDNVFDENIELRHTGDFGGYAEDLIFDWWYRPEDGTTARTPDRAVPPNPWKVFSDPSGKRGQGYFSVLLKGNPSAPEALIADSWFYTRYRHVNDVVDGTNWEVSQPNGALSVPYQWAGAGNSSPNDLDGDGIPDYKAQLSQGWIKRVLDAVNPYEARIRDFSGESPATYSSMIRQFGQHFEGPVALNPDKNVIENVGLIELYMTILDRGRGLSIDLSTPVSTPGIANALQLAATRLSDFHVLLGNEAYADAQNPTIAHGSSSVDSGSLPPTVFAFQNEVASLADEELALLRGLDDNKARPVYNRLFWNFFKGEGEAAYAMNYNITDVNNDGFIDEKDAMILYPQGHGDAWGHYLTATKLEYGLLRHPFFNWVSRSEFYNLLDIVIPVDFLDERKFAQAAAAKAKAGTEILNLTYRSRYVEDPAGQWQGYTDSNTKRGWGVEEWSRRTGQAAYFDWITANALLPAHHPNTNLVGIAKVDRTTVLDIAVVSANLNSAQQKFDQANGGLNPLGLAGNVVPFDIDPSLAEGNTHFDQIFERAKGALANASTILQNAQESANMLRDVANNEEEFRAQVSEQDLAYRNQLIEIFGSPYSGTIGSGKAYPAGYKGPDTMLFMYVDVRKVDDGTVPRPTIQYSNDFRQAVNGSYSSVSGGGIINVPNTFRTRYAPSLDDSNAGSQPSLSVNYTDFEGTPLVQLENLTIPVMARGYTFQAPPDWEQRSSPGELQIIINQMVQGEADLALAMANWNNVQADIIAALRLLGARYDMDKSIRDRAENLARSTEALMASELALNLTASTLDVYIDISDETLDSIAEAVKIHLPTVGLAISPGDAPGRIASAAMKIGKLLAGTFGKIASHALKSIAEGLAFKREIDAMKADLANDKDERNFAMIEAISAIESMVGGEPLARLEIFKQLQVMTELSDQYKAKVAEGIRLVEERTAFNKKVAAMAQSNRYQDMTFRVARNAALEKYRSAFDLAGRYAYLAAKAYDYDTNLDPNHPGSPRDILADIVRQRSIGLMGEDGPAVGVGGLAENMATLKANYDQLRTQMGINNPQIEQSTFSLRSEAFRSVSGPLTDDAWKSFLRSPQIYKANLWDVPEFRAYCRPFAAESAVPEPGLVIPFSTEIQSRRNFFGWPLGPLDSAYDPSVYATKILSAGIGFTGYQSDSLSRTPRVYLVPVGADIMTIPDSIDLNVRVWQVLDQKIPVPIPALHSNLGDPTWKPLTDSLNAPFGQTRQFSSFRAYGFEDEAGELGSFDSRLVGRSVWNTRWLLIIPGATLLADPDAGLNTFIENLKDAELTFHTFGVSGN